MNINRNTKILIAAVTVIVVTVSVLLFSHKKTVPAVPVEQPAADDTVAGNKPMPGDTGTIPVHVNSYELYRAEPIELFDKSKLFFVSVSDRYPFNDHPDSLNIPEESFKGKKAGEAPHIPLKGIYRKRLLDGTGIKESDSLYVYNYAKDVLEAHLIKNLKASAVINAYSSEDDEVYQYYYMIGFELPDAENRTFEVSEDYDNLVYIDPENIFTRGQVKAVHWADTGSKNFPAHSCKTKPGKQDNLRKYNVYTYSRDGYHYYAQESVFDKNAENYTDINVLHLLVTDGHENVVADLYFEQEEGGSPASLNNFSNDVNKATVSQYTGRLIKGELPMILGLWWASFGCESIYFLDPAKAEIYLNCDNRH